MLSFFGIGKKSEDNKPDEEMKEQEKQENTEEDNTDPNKEYPYGSDAGTNPMAGARSHVMPNPHLSTSAGDDRTYDTQADWPKPADETNDRVQEAHQIAKGLVGYHRVWLEKAAVEQAQREGKPPPEKTDEETEQDKQDKLQAEQNAKQKERKDKDDQRNRTKEPEKGKEQNNDKEQDKQQNKDQDKRSEAKDKPQSKEQDKDKDKDKDKDAKKSPAQPSTPERKGGTQADDNKQKGQANTETSGGPAKVGG